MSKKYTKDTPVNRLDLSNRAVNIILRGGIHTLGELQELSELELLRLRNMGKKTLKEISEKLEEIQEAQKTTIDNQLFWAKVMDENGNVKINAIIPAKENENAGYDIYACFDDNTDFICIDTLHTVLIPTGIACAVSEDYYLQVEERGSTGSKGIKKSAGVIDSGYRGEIFIAITNCNDIPLYIIKKESLKGNENAYKNAIIYPYEKAIAQLVVHKVEKMDEKEISYEELMKIPSKRGTQCLGSSKK